MSTSLIDLTAPFDPTAYAQISGAQLLQLVSGAVPYADKGMVILTTDVGGVPEVPDAATNTKWKRYIWLRQSATSVGIYVWNDEAASVATYLKWQAFGVYTIPAGTIKGEMIGDNEITDAKIADVDYSKITNIPNPTYPAGSVTSNALAANSVIPSKVAVGSGVGKMIRVGATGIAFEFFTPNVITQLADPVGIEDIGKPVVVNNTGTGFSVGAVTGQTVLQTVELTDATATTASNAETMPTNAKPTTANGHALALTQAVTPLSAASTLDVEVTLQVGSTLNTSTIAALFVDAGANAVAVGAASHASNLGNGLETIVIRYSTTHSGTTDEIEFSVRFGNEGAYASYCNRTLGGNTFGGLLLSRIKITERL